MFFLPDRSRPSGLQIPSLCASLVLAAAVGAGISTSPEAYATKPPRGKALKPALKPIAVPASLRFAYRFKPGDTLHYKVVGFFTGHFPPFAEPGSAPINLMVKLDYLATITKQSSEGTEVAFSVEQADINLLEKDPGPDGKVDPETETPFPLPLSQVQKSLNVVATLHKDGSVGKVTGGAAVPLNIGFELRKLFLLMLPVTFPDRAMKPVDEWNYADGVLGNKPGQVEYKGRLMSVAAKQRNLALHVEQTATANVNEMRDKDQKITEVPTASVDTTTGTVAVAGDFQFLAQSEASAPGQSAGLLDTGHLTMNVQLLRKRAMPDPNNPSDPLETNLDVRARLSVQREAATAKPHTAALPASQKEKMQ